MVFVPPAAPNVVVTVSLLLSESKLLLPLPGLSLDPDPALMLKWVIFPEKIRLSPPMTNVEMPPCSTPSSYTSTAKPAWAGAGAPRMAAPTRSAMRGRKLRKRIME